MEKEVASKQKKYRVASRFISEGQTPVTLVGGVAVSLGEKDAINDIAGTERHPPEKRVAKMATQAQLKILFEQGHEMVEQYED